MEKEKIQGEEVDTRTIAETFRYLSGEFRSLYEYLDKEVPTIPEDLCITEKYQETQESSWIVSQYFRNRSEGVQVDLPLSERKGTPGYEAIRMIEKIPSGVRRELEEDLHPSPVFEGMILIYGTYTTTLVEIAKVVTGNLSGLGGSLFPEAPSLEETEDYILQAVSTTLDVMVRTLEVGRKTIPARDSLSPKLRKKYSNIERTIDIILSSLYRHLRSYNKEVSLEEAKQRVRNIRMLQDTLRDLETEIGTDFKVERDPVTGKWRYLEFKSDSSSNLRPLEELRKLSSLPSLGQVNMSKDLVSSQFETQGDILEIGTEADKKKIRELQNKGKLLFGTLEGLSGGTAYFKSVSIALAKILNEQSLYFHPDRSKDKKGGLLQSGVPKERIKEIFGDSAKLEAGNKVPVIRGEERSFPYIFLSYERLAKELSKTGKISGGKDIEFVRLYINGGYREFTTDPKTGLRTPVKSSYVPGLTSKKYPVSDGQGHFLFIPFLVNEGEIVDTTKTDPEVGCLLRLSPQFSKNLQGYTALRGDTIQLIGGGRQKDITMDIISFLVFSRNTSPVIRKRKSEILSKYENRGNYYDPKTGKRRVSKLEAHFKEAIQKAISAKILQGYREERNSGGEVVSVFEYNPDYLKGENMSSPETQTGEE